jgi:hypothetical protein
MLLPGDGQHIFGIIQCRHLTRRTDRPEQRGQQHPGTRTGIQYPAAYFDPQAVDDRFQSQQDIPVLLIVPMGGVPVKETAVFVSQQ